MTDFGHEGEQSNKVARRSKKHHRKSDLKQKILDVSKESGPDEIGSTKEQIMMAGSFTQ